MKKAILILMILGFTIKVAPGQEVIKSKYKFGLGIALFNMSEYLYESSTGNYVYLTIYNNNFRVEPTIGFSFSKNLTKYSVGVGLFHQKELTDFKILSGIRIGASYRNIYFIAPTIGGEYYFNNHFSFGGEFQVRGSLDNGDLTILSNTSVIARFYF